MRIAFKFLAAAVLSTGMTVGLAVAQKPDQPDKPGQPGKKAQDGKPGQPGKKGQDGRPGQPAKPGSPQFDAKRFLKDHDANGDGNLTKDELPKRLQDGFDDVDKNHDGKLTAQELQAHARSMENRRPEMVELVYWVVDVPEPETVSVKELQDAYALLHKMDANTDGKLDKNEVMAYRTQRRRERVMNTFEYLDKDNDKKVSKAEARGLWADHFDELDTNHDGFLDEKEIDTAYDLKYKADAEKRAGDKKPDAKKPDAKKAGKKKADGDK